MEAWTGDIQKYGIAIVIGALLLFFLLERRFPLRQPRRKLGHRLLINASMSVLTFVTASVLVRPMALRTIDLTSTSGFGILHWLSLPVWAQFALGFLLLDVSFYYWHRLNHRIPFLWRFHNGHHLDPDLDVSTGFRFHFGEVALSVIFRMVQIGLIGVSLTTFVIYEFIFQLGTYFHHSNLRLPIGLERLLNYLMVTPRMHGIHHSQVHAETDSNYSVVFSVWDRMHRTFNWDIPQSEIEIGVPGYSKDSDNRLREVVLAPFRQQRDYWLGNERRANGSAQSR